MPYWSVGFLALSAAAQLGGGIALSCLGAAPVGMSLMGEGAGDLLSLYTAYTTGDFSLAGWAGMKAISYATMGVSMYGSALDKSKYCLQNAANGTRSKVLNLATKEIAGESSQKIVQNIAKEAIEEGIEATLLKETTQGDICKTAVENLLSLSLKQADTTVAETAGRHALNSVMECLAHYGVEKFRPAIEEKNQ